MSFRCEVCNEPQKPRSIPTMLVTESRNKNYPERKKGIKTIDRGGRGWEIVKEVRACAKCVKTQENK